MISKTGKCREFSSISYFFIYYTRYFVYIKLIPSGTVYLVTCLLEETYVLHVTLILLSR